ncbi:hypothetical protein HMPREF0294_0574 [Corynebacterium glucuronolyticum ATCC 51867]|nr:hypothetical protein HMPREF0294_0574 [Corynebacterium glucuronolyticum ATCC 51867]
MPGRYKVIRFLLLVLGLIPAGAGQMVLLMVKSRGWGAHPRRCGADHCARASSCLGRGSSPQVRGRSQRGEGAHHPRGLIPAGAGQMKNAQTICAQ